MSALRGIVYIGALYPGQSKALTADSRSPIPDPSMLLFSNPDSIALSLAHTQFLYSIRRSAAESLLTITKIQIMLIVSMAQSTRLMRQGCVCVW